MGEHIGSPLQKLPLTRELSPQVTEGEISHLTAAGITSDRGRPLLSLCDISPTPWGNLPCPTNSIGIIVGTGLPDGPQSCLLAV